MVNPNNKSNTNNSDNSSDINSNICWPCINCCRGTLVRVSIEDIERWKTEENYHTLLCVEEYPSGAKFLVHKKNSEECIFLVNDACSIYETRPDVCKRYPHSRENAIYFDCKLKDTFRKDDSKKLEIIN